MITFIGKSVFGGIAIGPIAFYKRNLEQIKRLKVEDPQVEIKRFETARETSASELKTLYQRALQEVGETHAAIFEIHQMMLEDLDYYESIINIINTQKVNAEYAIAKTSDNFSQVFASMDDAYMQGRAADVRDVSQRLLTHLSNKDGKYKNESILKFDEPVIIAADDLVPSETVSLDRSKVLAFVTMYGSVNSHTAILARTMNIPAVIGLGDALKEEYDGRTAVIDGFTGTVYIDPDDQILEKMRKKQREDLDYKALLMELHGQESVTLDGQKVNIYANIGNSADVGAVLQNGAEGIGLFRSEFLYLENDTYPTEEQQFQVYKTVAENMAGKKVIIRTLDIGADKQADYFQLAHEENPALGFRAIRICLTRKEIFKTQLSALCRASAFGQISIMFPMVISLKEVRDCKQILEEVKIDLRADGITFNEDIEIGIMIETPAAVMICDELAKEVDFFSIGTNDLTQYTLAIDRQNQQLEPFFDAHHPSVLRMIKMVIDCAHANHIWAGICGELGADPELLPTFLALEVDELSVSPSLVLSLRKKVRETDVNTIRQKALEKLEVK